MLQARPDNHPSPCGQQIMKAVVDLESRTSERDIVLTDLCPRNVMLFDAEKYRQRKIVFLEFEGAIFGRRLDGPWTCDSNLFLSQYISPLVRWDSYMAFPFDDWMDWDLRPWMEAEYAHEASYITNETREEYKYHLR